MPSQYQHRQFLRHVPNELLDAYFKAQSISLDIDFDKLKKTEGSTS